MSIAHNNRWEDGKEAHLALSDAAAQIYDDLYARANFATAAYMKKEEEVIAEVAAKTTSLSLALDLGSGTGRDSVILSKRFEQVVGYDFSKGMIGAADARRLIERRGNISYRQRDVEIENLPQASASVGLVNTGFGMGSFLQNPARLLREIRRVLAPQGFAIFSFYNRNSFARQLDLPWQPSLAAKIDPENECLNVTLPDSRTFSPSAKMYTVTEVERMLEQHFTICSIETYPSLSALMPQELFENPLAGKLCQEVDRALASNTGLAAGHYIIAVCQKPGKLAASPPDRGFKRAFELICRHGLEDQIQRHAPIQTMAQASEVIKAHGVQKSEMLKSILISRKDEETIDNPLQPPDMWLSVVQADRKVDFGKFARLVGVQHGQLEMARLRVLEDYTGFAVGAVPPFGMPKNIPIIFDEPIMALKEAWCGTGDPAQSIRIPLSTLEQMSNCSFADISKAGR